MKVYISVDIEGVTGVTSWAETELGEAVHANAAKQMKEEALAACRGAIAAGATEIIVHDSHDSGMNMWIDEFPEEVKLMRHWMFSPESMMCGIDETFDAAIFIGYHSSGGTLDNPLSHTMDYSSIFWAKVNGELMAEMDLNRLIGARYKVPVVFVSGDQGLCEKAKKVIPGVGTVPTKEGIGGATINRNPKMVCREIEAGVKAALENKEIIPIPEDKEMTLELCFRKHMSANKASYYPGVERVDADTVRFEAKNIKELVTAFYFIH